MTTGGGMGGAGGGAVDVIWIELQARVDGIDAQLAEIEARSAESGERAGTGFGGAMSAGLAVATTAAVALAGGLAAIAADSFNLAQESSQNVNNLQASLGLAREEAEQLGTVAEQVFAGNWGDSLTEVGDAVGVVRQQLGALSNEELQKVTEGAFAIRDTFGSEVPDTISTVQTLMEQFGLTSQQALDFVAKGFQDGLDRSGDFQDSINEYATQFANAGASAAQFYSALEEGAQGGALGTDKAADAFAEFRKVVQAGGEEVAASLNALGLNGEAMMTQLSSGQLSIADAFQQVVGKLSGVSDTVEQQQLGVALLGTLYEDLGQKGVAAMSLTSTSMGDMAGAADSLNAKYANLGSFMEGMGRQMQVALLPVGKELLSLANEAAPYLQQAFQNAGPVIADSINKGVTAARAFGSAAVNAYNSVQPVLKGASDAARTVYSFFKKHQDIAIPLAAGIGAMGLAYGTYQAALWLAATATAAWTTATTLAAGASVVLRGAMAFMTGPIGLVITAIGLLVAAGVYLYRNWDTLGPKAKAAWNAVVATIQNAMNGAVNYLRALPGRMLQIGIEIVNGLVNGIRSGAGRVGAAARELADNAWASVKSRLGIRSPSRVMHELGVFTGEGFVNGISSQNGKVRAAAQATAKGFLDAFKDLKLEKDVGRVDLSTYIKTLEQAQRQLRAKLGTVKEGSPAYREWLSALSAVGKELDSVRGKTKSSGDAAADAAKKVREAQQQIREGEAFDRWKAGLEGYSEAQLANAKAAAFAAGDQQRYNAVVAEQERRVKAAADALEKIREAQDKIRESEAFDRWKASLEGYSDAQLASAKAAAFAAGQTQEYNAILAEQERRLDAAKDATERLNKARQEMTSVLVDEGLSEVLGTMSNEDLAVWRDQSFEMGDKATWADARKAMQENGKEAAKGFVAGADEMLRAGDYAGALAHLREGLSLLGDEAALGYEVSQGVDELSGRIATLENALAEVDPVLASVVRSGGELFANLDSGKVQEVKLDTSWQDFLLKLEDDAALKEFVQSLEWMDEAQLQAALSAALLAEDQDQVKAVLAAGARYATESAKNLDSLTDSQRALWDAQDKLNGVTTEAERPFAKQIQNLEDLRGKPGVVTEELEALLAQWRSLQAEVEKENQLVAKINEWGDYAKQVIPVVISGLEALGGMSGETADAWAKDMGSMVSYLVSFGTAVASGNWVQAAVQAFTTIFGWLTKNKRAAEEAAKATKAYNEQFRFSDNGYGTREVTTRTTGMLFWSTTHYDEHIDELGKKTALSLENGFVQGMTNGMNEALKKGDFSLFEKSLKQSVGQAVLDGLMEAFLNQAILAEIIGPAIQEYMRTKDSAVLDRAIADSLAIGEAFYNEVKPIVDKYGLGDSSSGGSTGTTRSIGTAPGAVMSPRLEVTLPDSLITPLREFGAAMPIFHEASVTMLRAGQKLEALLDRAERIGAPLHRGGAL